MPKLSISIVNFNTKDYLGKCLESIVKNINKIDYEVIVADNNSHDGSVNMLKKDYPWVYTIANKKNLGAPIAKNQTFKKATGEYILILDSDIEILPGAIEQMLDFMDMNPEIGILGMDVSVTLERFGFRVKRKRFSSKIGKKHLIKPEEAIDWVTKNYEVQII